MTGLKRIKSGFVQAGGIWSKGWLTRTTQASAQEKIRVKHDACAWLVPAGTRTCAYAYVCVVRVNVP